MKLSDSIRTENVNRACTKRKKKTSEEKNVFHLLHYSYKADVTGNFQLVIYYIHDDDKNTY